MIKIPFHELISFIPVRPSRAKFFVIRIYNVSA